MIRISMIAGFVVLSAALVLAADDAATVKAIAHVAASKAAATQPANQNVTGTVTFTQAGGKVTFVADIDGLSPGKHGFHIHAGNDLSAPDLSSAKGHFNPSKEKHGGPESKHHHLGDLGNLTADPTGHAHAEGTIAGVTLDPGDTSIIDRSVIVHAKEDDLQTDPSGNSGGRVAGGVIELAQ